MKLNTCTLFVALVLTTTTTTMTTTMAEAKAYKGAEVYSSQSVLYGRMEMRMRMMRGSGLISTFFTYKNGSEMAGATWEEMDIEVLGKSDAKTWQSNLITRNPRKTSEQVYSLPTSLADGYHTYALEWTPEYVSWTFDGVIVRKTEGGQAAELVNAETLRFNAWASNSTGWAGALDESALPAYQFVNWIKYYRYDNGQFVLDWTDDFDTFDVTRWGKANWTFDGNLVDFDPANAVVKDGTLILAITKEGASGFAGTVPVDDGTSGQGADGGVTVSNPSSDSGCSIGGRQPRGSIGLWAMPALALAGARRRRSRRLLATDRLHRSQRPGALLRAGLSAAALLLVVLAPRAASATQGAELYRTQASFYGRFEARLRFAPGEGVVSSFFLWREGSSSTTSWNELDFEKINASCRMQTNIWTAKGTQSAVVTTPAFDICGDYHTYAIEWTPDYIAWSIDGSQIRKVTGASVTEYTQNASQGMSIHFNLWAGDSSFGGNFSASILPVRQYISWVQYYSYANGAFQLQWRDDLDGSTVPAGWAVGNWVSPLNHSTHNVANVSFANGIAVLSMTADNATGFTGTPPADASSGAGGATGTGGIKGSGGASGTGGIGAGGVGSGGSGTGGANAGSGGRNGAGGSASTGSGGGSATGSGGVTAGSGGSGTGGLPGTGGSSTGTGGGSATGGSGVAATGGAPGTGGDGSNATGSGSGSGCACHVSGRPLTGGAGSVLGLLIAASAVRRRRRS